MGNVTVLKHLACMWNEYSAVVDNGVRGSGIGNEQDSLLVLGNIAEEICKVAFAPPFPERCKKGYVPPNHYIPVGERTKAGRLFLAFLCDMGYLPEGTTVETFNEWFREPWKPGQLIGHNERNLRLYKAVMDDGRLACWLKENPKNAQRFWDVIRPDEPLPGEKAEAAEHDYRSASEEQTLQENEPACAVSLCIKPLSESVPSDSLLAAKKIAQALATILEGNLAGIESWGASKIWKAIYSEHTGQACERRTPDRIPDFVAIRFAVFSEWFSDNREDFFNWVRQ